MRPLTSEALRRLISAHPAPCVSIYLPLSNAPRAADHNRVRYEHLLARARGAMLGQHAARDVAEVMGALEALDRPEFWAETSPGLAAFACPGFSMHHRLPDTVEELAIVAASFHVRPLIGELQGNRHFFLLSLSQNHVQLFRGTRLGLMAVETNAPRSLEGALGVDRREHFVKQHAASAGGSSKGIFHGHGTGGGPAHEDLLRFFRAVEAAVWEELRHEKAPLVLACPIEYAPQFRNVCRYTELTHEFVKGNFERASLAELQERAWPIVERVARAKEDQLLTDFSSLAAHGRASAEISEIARFAVQGRVRELFLCEGEHLWGRFDRETGALDLSSPRAKPTGDDVLDDIAEAVLLRGGEVLALERDRMPALASAAVVLRW